MLRSNFKTHKSLREFCEVFVRTHVTTMQCALSNHTSTSPSSDCQVNASKERLHSSVASRAITEKIEDNQARLRSSTVSSAITEKAGNTQACLRSSIASSAITKRCSIRAVQDKRSSGALCGGSH
jgi:hypothetical protein